MKLHETRSVDKPIEEVFAYTSDFGNIEQWDPGVLASTQVGDGPVGAGTEFELEVKFGSSVIPMVYEITEYEPNSVVVLVGTGETLKAVDEIRFREEGGLTHIDYQADLTFYNFFRYLAPLASPLMKRIGEKAMDGLVGVLDP